MLRAQARGGGSEGIERGVERSVGKRERGNRREGEKSENGTLEQGLRSTDPGRWEKEGEERTGKKKGEKEWGKRMGKKNGVVEVAFLLKTVRSRVRPPYYL